MCVGVRVSTGSPISIATLNDFSISVASGCRHRNAGVQVCSKTDILWSDTPSYSRCIPDQWDSVDF